ncbi:Transmembrane protein [Orchesella cincta]|uniref:Transmembrane protein n=1 Tax=Orchesella cincta TaxID=48709 RepID=A0A1D2NKE3_ORCCI|nr:Transmembrane protein [Orchesella cincta]
MDRRTLKPPVKIALLEKKESEVSHCWKTCQLFSYVLVVISGIATSLAMGNVQRLFKGHCILYADLKVTLVENWTIIDKPQHTASRWGSHNSCNFCQFCPVASVVFAGILGTLFVMCGRGGRSSRNLPQPWRIVPPAIMFNFIFLLTSCASVALTFGGFSAFCSSIGSQLNVSSCEDLIGYHWYRYPNATFFYDDVVIAETGATVGLVGWLMGFIILLIRVITHADFMVISPGKSVAAAIAATGTTQMPIGSPSSQEGQSGVSSSRSSSQRSCSANDISKQLISSNGNINAMKPYRQRTMSTGSGNARNNNNKPPSTPIVINNHHHLHLHHCHHCGDDAEAGTTSTNNHSKGGAKKPISGKSEGTTSGSEITLINEVEPLLKSKALVS